MSKKISLSKYPLELNEQLDGRAPRDKDGSPEPVYFDELENLFSLSRTRSSGNEEFTFADFMLFKDIDDQIVKAFKEAKQTNTGAEYELELDNSHVDRLVNIIKQGKYASASRHGVAGVLKLVDKLEESKKAKD